MRLAFYGLRLDSLGAHELVKERVINAPIPRTVRNPEDVQTIACDILHLDRMPEEEVWLLALRMDRLIGVSLISKGTSETSLIDAKAVFTRALAIGAGRIILVHNHPSGNISLSEQDIAVTKKIKEGGKLLDITLSDHIVVSPDGTFTSMLCEKII